MSQVFDEEQSLPPDAAGACAADDEAHGSGSLDCAAASAGQGTDTTVCELLATRASQERPLLDVLSRILPV
ncbi:MAG TPA: hypothetical protein VN324_02490 [Quisquiliibacterium sp.]|nr:hypothetical protein [Quisquiliibacterium sp.]